MDNLLTVAFEAHNQEQNHHRHYGVTLGRDLLDDWTIAINLRPNRFGRPRAALRRRRAHRHPGHHPRPTPAPPLGAETHRLPLPAGRLQRRLRLRRRRLAPRGRHGPLLGHPVVDGQETSLSPVPRQDQRILRAPAASTEISPRLGTRRFRDDSGLYFGTGIGTRSGLPRRISGSFSERPANPRNRDGRP